MRVGYLIVRKPGECFDPNKGAVWAATTPPTGPVLYSGVDRMPWYDVGTAIWSKTASDELSTLFNSITARNAPGAVPLLSASVDSCHRLLVEVGNADLNEIAGISYPARSHYNVDATKECAEPPPILGYDVVIEGEFSLLGAGVHQLVARDLINERGLLARLEDSPGLIAEYERLERLGLAEPSPSLSERCVICAVHGVRLHEA